MAHFLDCGSCCTQQDERLDFLVRENMLPHRRLLPLDDDLDMGENFGGNKNKRDADSPSRLQPPAKKAKLEKKEGGLGSIFMDIDSELDLECENDPNLFDEAEPETADEEALFVEVLIFFGAESSGCYVSCWHQLPVATRRPWGAL